MKLLVNIGRKGFTINRLPGQEIGSITALLPRTDYDYEAQVNGYQSAIIMACIRWLQRTFPEAPLMLQRRDKEGSWEEIYEHSLLTMTDSPNPHYDGILLQMATIADFMLDGNAYWLKRRSEAGRVVQIWWLPSTTIEPKWPGNGTEFLSHYEYRPGNVAPMEIKPADIIHFRDGFDPNNLRKGLSGLKSLFREVFTDDEAANMTASILKNLGVPGLLISPAGTATVDKEGAEQVKQWFKDNFTGDKRGEPLVMSSATEVKPFGFSPKDMALRELRKIPEERISAVLGVPAIVAGLGAGLDRSTYANYAEAREAAYEGTIIPLQRIIASAIKRQFLSDYETDLQAWNVGFDLGNVRILQEDENKKAERVGKMVSGGYLKITDAQRMTGIPVDETQDYYLRPFNLLSISSGPPPEPASEKEPAKAGKKNLELDEMVKETWWKVYAIKAENYEDKFKAGLRKMFASQEKEAIENLKAGKEENLIDQEKAREDYKDLAMPLLSDLMAEAINDARAFVEGPQKQRTLVSQAATLWLRTRIGWAASEVGEQTAHLLAVQLASGHAKGESIPQLTKRVREVFGFCSRTRAERIARTETIQASAQGAIEGYKEAGVSRLEFYAALDERTCDECMNLHGTEFPINETEGIITVHPGCRCTWLPVI